MSEQADVSMGGDSPKAQPTAPVNDSSNGHIDVDAGERASKRLKMDDLAPPQEASNTDSKPGHVDGRVKGLAPVKKEYLIDMANKDDAPSKQANDDDAAEGRGPTEQADRQADDRKSRKGGKKDRKKGGQNTERNFGKFDDAIRLCNSRAFYPEFSPRECRFAERCRLCHDLRKYLDEGRREDSHMKEIEHEDGRKELTLIDNSADDGKDLGPKDEESEEQRPAVSNIVSMDKKIDLNRKRVDFTRADQYIQWLNQEAKLSEEFQNRRKTQSNEGIEDLRARYIDPPFKPSEKRRLYFGPETPTLAPLTTQGNLPFRRLCVEFGAQLTYSEMAMGMPLIQGNKADWTLLKVHDSELSAPKLNPGSVPVFDDYDHKLDLKFGAQISASNYWVVTKAADVLNRYCPHLRLIDLNCGCPIDMVFKSGGGSALLDNQGKLERMIRGMNATSGEVPITAKIRTGVRNNRPTATQLIGRLAFGAREHRERLGAPGCAALTLHGRSREQRYTKKADWGYIGECAALVKTYNSEKAALTDTIAEPDASTLPNAKNGRMYFLGNGDCYSHTDYFENIEKAHVDTVMIGRGALIKPWLFEEIEKGQYLDKSSSERLTYIEKFVRYGLEAWGSDELGIGFTRRFLLEWLSFTHRYVPIGLLEHLPPNLNDRPPAYKGRDELETLMASSDFRDWIKISEMFLGPVHPTFRFQPKHKSHSYEAEG
ncbi:hypothetical protein B0J13DRAFT_545748 [Dactylonectria estremocensis]|uniref:tRNA-dihydrouridine(47) synthase [NAD(P)(+)] n=1 Tax=Dactylonectria estremocensis TaxID=1079267 RepID=A0A9P9F7R4_9HYPO|nr:hypothetical protein B0J13DRAFT_545748 [Dactylonectria estremocensis]